MKKRAVFLDRDGVLNEAVVKQGKLHPPPSVNEVVICDGVPSACRELRSAGFLLIVVTNQPDVARGAQTKPGVEAINQYIARNVELDDFRVCYHDDADNCPCRKPQPGLLIDSARDWDIDLHNSFMVGDRTKDIAAGANAGCRTIFVGHGSLPDTIQPDLVAKGLPEAVGWILKQNIRAEEGLS